MEKRRNFCAAQRARGPQCEFKLFFGTLSMNVRDQPASRGNVSRERDRLALNDRRGPIRKNRQYNPGATESLYLFRMQLSARGFAGNHYFRNARAIGTALRAIRHRVASS